MYWDMEDVVHSTVEGRTVRMVLAGPLLGVVLEEGEEFVQLKSSKQNSYINTI